jgi:hypothetical protein
MTQALDQEPVRARAAREAAEADVIVIATADLKTGEALKRWTNEWEKKREIDSGLLVLIPCNESRTGGDLAEFLNETALSASMDFLCRKPRRF